MSAMPSSPPSLQTLNNTIGALEAGGMISCLLMGIVSLQVYHYYSTFPNDSVGLKILVAFVWICELGQSICVIHAIYVMTVVSWADARVFTLPPKTLSTAFMFAAFSTPIIQGFFAWRIRVVAKTWTITIVSWSLALVKMIMGLVVFVKGVTMVSFNQYLKQSEWAVVATLVTGTTNDVLIAVASIWVLRRERNSTLSRR
ncbi:hypothetical protein V5O48_015346 [Marasmius crinis-equi]|uniref:Integral membrane protein n=1 Tax=Marasmius crinis-equi TaxID=585013 RepID=A0ABR3EUU3_9AGAR